MSEADAARVAEYLVEEVRSASGSVWRQGRRATPIDTRASSPALRLIAEHRLHRVGELESRALLGWAADTRRALLSERMVEPSELVALQAEGRRCVAPLGLDFVLHDLRHLEKFFDPLTHRAQIGFFRLFARAMARNALEGLDRELDEIWRTERDRVLADMNGSPIFLFAVLKMKLKVAARRLHARDLGADAPARGALDGSELAVFARLLERLLDALELEGRAREAARRISTRRDQPRHARTWIEHLCSIA